MRRTLTEDGRSTWRVPRSYVGAARSALARLQAFRWRGSGLSDDAQVDRVARCLTTAMLSCCATPDGKAKKYRDTAYQRALKLFVLFRIYYFFFFLDGRAKRDAEVLSLKERKRKKEKKKVRHVIINASGTLTATAAEQKTKWTENVGSRHR